jgi:diacylglycerol O-acyltransferase
MKQLSMTDAAFLYLESAQMPMTIASVQVLDPPSQPVAQFLTGLRTLLRERVHRLPYLTHRVRFVPGNLDHPVWEADRRFDIANHVTAVSAGGAGTMADLERAVAALHEAPLERDRPLWRLVVIEGLAGGRVAFYNACHHACLDGQGGQAAVQLMMDTSPEPARAPPQSVQAPPRRSPADLLWSSVGSLTRSGIDQWSRLPAYALAAGRLAARSLDPRQSFGAFAMQAPSTRFNVAIDGRRSYAVGRLPLADVKAIGRATDCKVNDVFMTVVGGALKRYLERRQELPARPLLAGCPVSLRELGDETPNNQVTMMPVSLATDLGDARARLVAVRDSAKVSKAVIRELRGVLGADVRLLALPAMVRALARALETTRAADYVPAPLNLVVSNVPGPRVQLYGNGSRMLTHFPVSVPAHGTGVNITVQSYLSHLDFSVTAAVTALPNARELRDDLLHAYVELRRATLGGGGEVTGWSVGDHDAGPPLSTDATRMAA